jgi:hypothetical protein
VNEVNLSLQGKQKAPFVSGDKIRVFNKTEYFGKCISVTMSMTTSQYFKTLDMVHDDSNKYDSLI